MSFSANTGKCIFCGGRDGRIDRIVMADAAQWDASMHADNEVLEKNQKYLVLYLGQSSMSTAQLGLGAVQCKHVLCQLAFQLSYFPS